MASLRSAVRYIKVSADAAEEVVLLLDEEGTCAIGCGPDGTIPAARQLVTVIGTGAEVLRLKFA